MTLKLKLLKETPLARFYEHPTARTRQWVPRSVCRGGGAASSPSGRGRDASSPGVPGDLHEVSIEDWWLQQNPFTKPDPEQASLL